MGFNRHPSSIREALRHDDELKNKNFSEIAPKNWLHLFIGVFS